MKKILAALLLVCMAVCLCACGNNEPTEPQNTAPQITLPQVTEPEPTGVTYTVKVVDEGGNAVSGVMVQLCAEQCVFAATNENGVASFADKEERDDYKASVLQCPEGYEMTGDTNEYYYGSGVYEVTITVKAVA